jgi:hypothetical protein
MIRGISKSAVLVIAVLLAMCLGAQKIANYIGPDKFAYACRSIAPQDLLQAIEYNINPDVNENGLRNVAARIEVKIFFCSARVNLAKWIATKTTFKDGNPSGDAIFGSLILKVFHDK